MSESSLSPLIPHIASIEDAAFRQQVQQLLDNKTKPLGSLGLLEAVALRIACILGSTQPRLANPQMLVFAADHGLVAQGVSAYPADVTWQMVGNFMAGGAAVSVLSRQHGVALNVVDCGVARDFEPQTEPLPPGAGVVRRPGVATHGVHNPPELAGSSLSRPSRPK